MKYFKVFLTILSLVLSTFISFGCSSKEVQKSPDSAEDSRYAAGQDYQYMYFTQGSVPQMAESNDGYYFFSGNYLYYADKKNMKPVILCNKPNCLHDREKDPYKIINCDAFIEGSGPNQFLAYYGNNLYSSSVAYNNGYEQNELIQISPDGTKRKSVLKLDMPPASIAIHRGKVYYTQTAFDKNQKAVYQITEFDLKSTFAKPRDIYIGSLEGGSIQDLLCYDNNLYFVEFAHNSNVFATRVMRYDISSEKVDRLFTNDDTVSVGVPAIYDNKLYYSISKINVDGTIKEEKFFTCDLDGKNIKETLNFNYLSNVLADRHHLYIDDVSWSPSARPKDRQCISIIDKTGKVIDSIKTGSIKNSHTVVCAGEDHLFVKTYTDDKFIIYYADKKQFGSGRIQLKPFFEIDKDRMTPAVIRKN